MPKVYNIEVLLRLPQLNLYYPICHLAFGFPPPRHSFKITRPPPAITPCQIISDIEDLRSRDNYYITISPDRTTISKLDLVRTIDGIVTALVKAKLI